MILLLFPTCDLALGEKNQTILGNSSISRENIDNFEIKKIHQTILQWLNSENPQESASQLKIPYKEGKIAVYIYLEDAKFASEIPSEIEVISSSQNIVRAFVAPQDIFELEKFDSVTRITPPEIAQTPPIPKVGVPQSQHQEDLSGQPQEQENSYLWIIIPIVLIITAIIVITSRKRH